MNDKHAASPPEPPERSDILLRLAGMGATAGAWALAVLLAVRWCSSFDTGYHLAYGDEFLDHGEIVQTNRFIYTRLDPRRLSLRENLGPGCWYDAASNTYHFVNANWLSQVIMSLVYHWGGFDALTALQAALVAAIFAVMILTMRRALGAGPDPARGRPAGWHWIAPAILLAAMTAYGRFNLRPELFGYLVLAGQWCLLVGGNFGWRAVGGVIALQVLAVNLHSYFILGIALTGAMLADAVLRWVWGRAVTGTGAAAHVPRMKRLGVAAAGVILASLVNPWGVRGAIFPVETLLYLGQHDIAGRTQHPGAYHPWETIGEFTTPFAPGQKATRPTKAFVVLLGLTGAGGVAAALRRRWGWLAAMAGMTLVSLNMRRNIAPGAMILAPIVMIALADGWRWLAEKLRARGTGRPRRSRWGLLERLAATSAALATTGLAGWWIVGVVTQRLYFSEGRSWRFAGGYSRFVIPTDAAEWINTHAPKGRVFTDYDTSSNLMYFTNPRREVPVLTNTFAYPPYLMREVLEASAGGGGFEPFVEEYGVTVVVVRSSEVTPGLIRRLSKSPDWAVVHLGIKHPVFVRRTGADAAIAKDHEITPETFDVGRFIEEVSRADPVPGFALHNAAAMLWQLGWQDHALTVWERVVALEPNYCQALNNLGMSLGMRGTRRLLAMQQAQRAGDEPQARSLHDAALDDWRRAEECFLRALRIDPSYADAGANLKFLREQIAAFRQGRILVPPDN